MQMQKGKKGNVSRQRASRIDLVAPWQDRVDKSESRKRHSATYNLLALLNTRLDLGNVPRCIVVSQLLNLMLAHDR
jgi:hypothetical protein